MLGELAGGIAHQLSTPLQLISTNLHFLKRSWPSIEEWMPANDNAGTSNANAGTSSNANTGTPGNDLSFILQEVPAALMQSLQSLDEMSLLLRAMKEWCAPQDGTLQPVEPESVLRRVLILTQHRWCYSFTVAQHSVAPLPVLHCGLQDITAALTQVVLLVADALTARVTDASPDDLSLDELPHVDISCISEGAHTAFVLSWRGSAPDASWTDALSPLALRLQGDVVVDVSETDRVSLRLRVPSHPSANEPQ